MKTLLALGMLIGAFANVTFADATDRDNDDISDALEQALIERFRPQFWLDVNECGGLPAEFQADAAEPRVLTQNGTIYARVSPSTALGPESAALTVSYYHLWDQDCGPLSPHPARRRVRLGSSRRSFSSVACGRVGRALLVRRRT